MKLEEAEKIAQELERDLAPACERIQTVGSVRRRKPEVKDIEFLCVPLFQDGTDMLDQKLRNLMQAGVLDYRLNKLGSRIYGTQNKLLKHTPSGMAIDVFSTDRERWPVALVVRTGPDTSNMAVASAAKRRGWRFRAYGTGFDTPQGHIRCYSERDVFEKVGLQYKLPEERA